MTREINLSDKSDQVPTTHITRDPLECTSPFNTFSTPSPSRQAWCWRGAGQRSARAGSGPSSRRSRPSGRRWRDSRPGICPAAARWAGPWRRRCRGHALVSQGREIVFGTGWGQSWWRRQIDGLTPAGCPLWWSLQPKWRRDEILHSNLFFKSSCM